jgi:hypothetical protein
MSLFDLFRKTPKINQKTNDMIYHFLNSANLNTAQKTAIIYLVQLINSVRLGSKEKIYKDYHEEFFNTTISLAGLNLNGYNESIKIFKNNEVILNNTIEHMNTNQKVVIVLLFQIFISFCEHNGEDLTGFKDKLQQVYDSIDPNVNLLEKSIIEFNKFAHK